MNPRYGNAVRHGTTDDLVFSVPYIVACRSTLTESVAGDVIATGTPHGVGLACKKFLWMKPCDIVEVEISDVGVLRKGISAEQW